MKKALWTNTLREIGNSFGRYMAILAIVGLGVGFYAGLSASQDAMIETGDEYFRDCNFHDLRLISTLGLEDKDVEAFRELDFVRNAEGAYSTDALVNIGDVGTTVKFLSLSDKINVPIVTEGRAPVSENECLLDDYTYRSDVIGSKVSILDSNKESTLDLFKVREFTVVGLCRTPLYVNYERGATSVGDGTLAGFICVPAGAFDSEYYTEIYAITDASDEKIYSDRYEDRMEEYEDRAQELLDELAFSRYTDIKTDAEEEIAEARGKLDDAKAEIADHEKEIADNEQEIADHEQEIADGEQEIADHELEIEDGEREIADGEKEIRDGESKLSDGYSKLEDARAELDSMKAFTPAEMYAMQKKLLDDSEAELKAKEKELKDAKKKIEDAKADIEEGKVKIADARAEIEDAKVKIADGKV
ncbi:MAG: hypothetical protein K6E19_06425, partial [Lachnospiraceae bacterium]|nr:hypothetical protein [Lachnospiraceae bacterium]